MIDLFRLGLKNVLRQRLRTGLALLAIALAVGLVVLGMTLVVGAEAHVFGGVVGDAGEVVVARAEYFKLSRFNPLEYSIHGSAGLRDRLLRTPGVRAAVRRIDFSLLAQIGEEGQALACSAVDVAPFGRESPIPGRIIAGRYLRPAEKAVLLGSAAAERIGARPGDRVTLLGRTAYDSFTADDFTVVGIYDLGTRMQNRSSVMPLAAAQEFLEMPDAASRILLYSRDGPSYESAERIAERLRTSGVLPASVAVRPWTQDAFLGSFYAVNRAVRIGVASVICFVAGLGILNMMMVSVLERRREIGVLMALGMSKLGVLTAFVWEALLYGLLGTAGGLLLGSPAALYLDRVGIELKMTEVEGLPFAPQDMLHGRFGPEALLAGAAIGILLGLLGMVWPVVKALSMGPKDAMAR